MSYPSIWINKLTHGVARTFQCYQYILALSTIPKHKTILYESKLIKIDNKREKEIIVLCPLVVPASLEDEP